MTQRVRWLLAAASLVACGEPAVNSTTQVEIRVINSTGLSNVVVTVSWATDDGSGSSTSSFPTPEEQSMIFSTGRLTAGDPLRFQVKAGEGPAGRTCHVQEDAIGNEHNVPTAVIEGEPLRIVCRSGWQEGLLPPEPAQVPD